MPERSNRQSPGVGVNRQAPSYPNWMGFIFVFNLIVGTGALTVPGIFAKAGWLLSLITILLLGIISYITVTFIIEAMASANAVKTWQNLQVLKLSYDVGIPLGGNEIK